VFPVIPLALAGYVVPGIAIVGALILLAITLRGI
jgi:hypothetical protein